MYRKEIKVLDCTIRDGGLMNNHLFTDDFLSAVFKSVNSSGVDYIELGYKADESQFSRSEYGSMKFCSEKDIEKVVMIYDRLHSIKLTSLKFDKQQLGPETVKIAKDLTLCLAAILYNAAASISTANTPYFCHNFHDSGSSL